MRHAALPLALLLGACAGREAPAPVLIPVHAPCVTGQLPSEPRRIQSELTGDSGRDIGLIAGSAIELRAWGAALYGLLVACQASAPVTPQP